MQKVDNTGGMYKAVEAGLVQTMIGESAMARQEQIESGVQKIVGANCYQDAEDATLEVPTSRPDPEKMQQHVEDFKLFKENRSQKAVDKALDKLARAAGSDSENVFAAVVDAAEIGVTHGEIIACLRKELGFGHPLIIA
jgi:methylmalonyl-CoA mutase N-terminal domain/subunit